MSQIKTIVEVSPSTGWCDSHREAITLQDFECTKCNGRGGWYIDSRDMSFDTSVGEHYKACSLCKGSGIIQPTVTITWATSGEIKEQFKNSSHEK